MRIQIITSPLFLAMVMALPMTACVETSSTTASSLNSGSATTTAPAPQEKLTKHDAALRFLTAFIRLDRGMALQYATPEAVSKLNWNMPHGGNIPYYDDKMILYYRGGLAKVYFQEDANGSFRVSNLHVY
ncbi:hypothetical protein VSU19_06000 [Verrucomicrobiales bacterium BCK34]|nr:hypothetical protein [Verrucomicrobiales bacterium BCK34]